ncbi:MAG TPA: hypothetical protein VFD70_13935 [Anaerolineae bacterium]|nr:hypothetical protein [Anaerolineae bacterium]
MASSFTRRVFVALVSLIFILMLAAGLGPTRILHAQSPDTKLEWSRPIPISEALIGSSYPAIAADDTGQVFLIWSAAIPSDTIYISRYDGSVWSRPNDILIGGPRSILELDGRNELHVMLVSDGTVLLKGAAVADSGSARGWGTDAQLSRGKTALIGDFLTDSRGVIHAIWFESSQSCESCYRVAYLQLNNPAKNTSTYRAISDSVPQPKRESDDQAAPPPAQHGQLVRLADGTLFAMWNAALPGKAGIQISVSKNDGDTWLDEPISFSAELGDLAQPYLLVDKEGKFILIYNVINKDETFYSVSTDQGVTWTEAAPIPGLFAGKPSLGTDYFAAAYDSEGTAHVIAVGRTSKEQPVPGLYHLQWDGKAWMPPEKIYLDDNFVNFPAVAISNGNKLHVSFATLDKNRLDGEPNESYQVWYSTAQTSAAQATRVPLPTLTPQPTPLPTEPVTATPTRRPSPTPDLSQTSGEDDATDINAQLPLIIGIVPVIGILVLVVVLNSVLRRRH